VPPGWLQLDDAQRHNLHAEHNERYEFKTFEPTAGDRLAEVELEARLMQPSAAAELVHLDARAVVKALKQRCIGHVLAVGEVILITVAGHALRLRVAQTDTADAAARDELVAYHCYRGLLAPETDVYLHAMQDREDATGAAFDLQSRGGGLELTDCPLRPPSVPSANRVTVNCNDDEFFLVHKQVLRPCITLTGAVRAAGPAGGSEVQVDVSCLVFDRVLLFLEAEAQARPTPEFGINLLDELLDAARKLGLRSLEDYCATRLGEFSSRLREYSFAEIKQRNAAGECLIIVDGMVLDVTRWLPEHPGGSTIIPTQALNMDAARFYEVYHASRESFLYVKSFYIGAFCAPISHAPLPRAPLPQPSARMCLAGRALFCELLCRTSGRSRPTPPAGEVSPQDRALVPQPEPGPSVEFIEQLKAFTIGFRLPVTGAYKSF